MKPEKFRPLLVRVFGLETARRKEDLPSFRIAIVSRTDVRRWTNVEESMITADSGRAGGQVSAGGYGQILPALFRWTPGPYQRDYCASANHDGLQGIKDSRGPVGMTATRRRGPQYSQPPLGARPSKCIIIITI
jgi:hypothetical protein